MKLEEEAREFWSEAQPGFRFSGSERGSREFFADVERHRYSLEPHIHEIVQFERWRDRDVLDAGCGIATDGLQFARAGARYVGLDFSPVALELARRRFALEGQEARFVEGSVVNLPFEDESFDLVYSHGVIHHVDDTQRAVDEFHRVLRPGGTALVMVYHRGSLNYRFNILGVRRALAGLLLVPGAVDVVARVTGEELGLLAAHAKLLRKHGLRYLTDRGLFLSKNTDGPTNPLSKVYSRREALDLFRAFDDVRPQTRFLNLRIYPAGDALAKTKPARRLERRVGWHLYVEASKAASPPDAGGEPRRSHADREPIGEDLAVAQAPANEARYRLITDVEFGDDVIVHPFTNLYGCRIGANTRIGPFVEIQRGAAVGANCKIQSHTFICSGVQIDDEVFVGHGVLFINDKYPRATDDKGRLQTEDDWELLPTVVERGASLGSGAVILGGVRIQARALVGAGAVVTRDVAPGAIVRGNPARSDLAERLAHRRRLDEAQ